MANMTREEKRINKIERTLVRLKYSLAADDEIDARRETRERALAAGEDYTVDVPQLLASVEDQVNDPNDQ